MSLPRRQSPAPAPRRLPPSTHRSPETRRRGPPPRPVECRHGSTTGRCRSTVRLAHSRSSTRHSGLSKRQRQGPHRAWRRPASRTSPGPWRPEAAARRPPGARAPELPKRRRPCQQRRTGTGGPGRRRRGGGGWRRRSRGLLCYRRAPFARHGLAALPGGRDIGRRLRRLLGSGAGGALVARGRGRLLRRRRALSTRDGFRAALVIARHREHDAIAVPYQDHL